MVIICAALASAVTVWIALVMALRRIRIVVTEAFDAALREVIRDRNDLTDMIIWLRRENDELRKRLGDGLQG